MAMTVVDLLANNAAGRGECCHKLRRG